MNKKINNKKINSKTKIVFVTGGVISGIGKGIVASSIGNILKSKGFTVSMQKLDPYLNYDPGVLSPFEHGEVFVTYDGGETDLDLGHYERFINEKLSRYSNFTSGKIFLKVNEKERKGFYQGKTVQIFPHFTNEIIAVIKETIIRSKNPDFFIVEIGGTVGDMESISFLRAISEMGFINPENTYYVHTTYIPFLNVSKEFKTKPTQFSIQELNSIGIKANMIFLRTEKEISKNIIHKISMSSFLEEENIISLPNLNSVYKVPKLLEEQKVSEKILKHFNLEPKQNVDQAWNEFVEKIDLPKKHSVRIAMIGKYINGEDAYNSIKEAFNISAIYNSVDVKFKWILADNITKKNIKDLLKNCDGVVILPGFGSRGFEGKVISAKYTKDNNIPTLGICLGMQAMTISHARDLGIENATSFEFANKRKKDNYIFNLIDDKNKDEIGGTLRLGEYKIIFKPNSLFNKVYNSKTADERHRHRYEVMKEYKNKIEKNGFVFSGFDSKSNLIETCELKNHKFYLGTQYHPEFNANPRKEHPLFSAFLKSTLK
ncbi:MAG: CTP synthase [Metamycoplasmataceae bacterium]